MAYRLIFADFMDNFDIKSSIGMFFFVLATLFLIVIMLNLLISIISDTFDRLQMDQKAIECRQRCQMIFDAELMLFWRRNSTDRKYVKCIEYQHLSRPGGLCQFGKDSFGDADGLWMGRVA